MKTIWYVPIEPLAERYTEQWYTEFPKAFTQSGYSVQVIDGEALRDFVKVGTFLDITSTVHYKSAQMKKIAKAFDDGMVKDGDTFFFGDIEFWGIESVRLMADMLGLKVKLTGFLHAASYTVGDAFEIAAPYQRFTEVGWLACLDTVFVGSQYHKDAVLERRLRPLQADYLSERIFVSGNPLFRDAYHAFAPEAKKLQVVLSNRFDAEKDVGRTLDLFESMKLRYPEWSFVITTSRKVLRSNAPALEQRARDLAANGVLTIHEGLTKEQYHRVLSESAVMVSHSPEESFGYCVVEAAHYNCQPLLLNGASHPELVQNSTRNLFTHYEDAPQALYELMANPQDVRHFADAYFDRPLQVITRHL